MTAAASARAALGTLFVNGKKVATGRIERTQCCIFSADEGADVGADEGTPVTEAYKVPFKFTGKIDKVTIELTQDRTNRTDLDKVEKARREVVFRRALAD